MYDFRSARRDNALARVLDAMDRNPERTMRWCIAAGFAGIILLAYTGIPLCS
ncbi:MAG TPA: hypothetical protein VFL98_00815 [Candidatus Paceibacterota bacterium]|nr:hypothetical protein [Candidatus Paceibacterota bacterium]